MAGSRVTRQLQKQGAGDLACLSPAPLLSITALTALVHSGLVTSLHPSWALSSLRTQDLPCHHGSPNAWNSRLRLVLVGWDRRMDGGRIGVCMYLLLDGWMYGWVDGWMGGRVYGWVDGWMGGWMDGWMDGWMGGWMKMGRWVDEDG